MFDRIKKIFSGDKEISSLKGKCIMVADDSDVDRLFVQRILQNAGCDVVTANDGQQCLDKIKKAQIDLAILDCDMPHMGGLDVCRQIKSDQSTKEIPVIFLTSDDTPANIFSCFEMEAENYLKKPISAKALLNELVLTFEGKT